ncbi:hypothetical protein DFQ28_010095 [Apophysomyces sp. BC1034]|nr:hypothetical protein DFQ29_008552 [Apophysomyces sp. BC1021]KAG0185008.1 hypothetical protein DFQ28_010095 [Apophysomyces sp. BC1034]
MAVACMDAAHMLDIPVIVTTTMSMSEDTRAPFIRPSFNFDTATTLDKSLWERFVERYFTLPRFILRQRPVLVALNEIRRQLGIKPWEPLGRHAGTIKFINAFWGVESPRPVGPFVEYVGPVMNRHYDPLTPALAQFLDRHSRVVYIAFGQMYAPNTREFGTLLTGLLEAYEEGILDGLVWSLSRKRSMDLPPTIQTSRKTYNTSNLLNGVHKDMRFEPWSPQFAVLNHCSCKLFVSHGGASSIHESLYNGVPMLLHPFTSDQPVNSEQLAKAGVGLVIDRRTSSPEDIVRKIRSMVLDEAGDYAVNIKTMQALVQIRSRRRHYAADIVEEVLYSVRGKKNIWHRKEDVWHMRWWKATNWDVDGLAFFLMILSVAFVYRTLLPMQRHFVNNYLVSKVKQKAV